MKTMVTRLFIAVVVLGISVYGINKYVSQVGARYIMDEQFIPKADAILVLGAYVFPDGTVSYMLDDRLSVAYDLYKEGKADKIIVSGDHGQKDYDEVHAMKQYLVNKNIPAKDIFMDHAGFNTYQSVYRARDIFKVKKLIIVTQEYHLLRAVFDARELGIEAYGLKADMHDYGIVMNSYLVREIAARNKDFFLATFIQPEPKFLGDEIPVNGDGRATED
ncbi:vancomycin permeability regulator SanA [Sporomusa sp. KB1]|nr:vancomycin permeability regulator SanA [Sporomusa sp. KB1]